VQRTRWFSHRCRTKLPLHQRPRLLAKQNWYCPSTRELSLITIKSTWKSSHQFNERTKATKQQSLRQRNQSKNWRLLQNSSEKHQRLHPQSHRLLLSEILLGETSVRTLCPNQQKRTIDQTTWRTRESHWRKKATQYYSWNSEICYKGLVERSGYYKHSIWRRWIRSWLENGVHAK